MLSLLLAASITSSPQLPTYQRPRDIWVFRSVLDRRARIVTAALNDKLWVAYDAVNCGLYKAWFGGVKFDGAVYTTAHGPQPTSLGMAYAEGITDRPVWSLGGAPVKAEFKGYRLNGKQVTFSYRLTLPGGKVAMVKETPEYLPAGDGRSTFERIYEVQGVPKGQRLALQMTFGSVAAAEDIKTDGTLSVKSLEANRPVAGELLLNNDKPTRLAVTFMAPPSGRAQRFAMAQQEPTPREPGVSVRVYDIGEEMTNVPSLVAGQTPNVSFVAPNVNLSGNKDFRGPDDKFVAIVTGFINVKNPGLYTFRLSSDDGSIFWINEREIINHDGLHGAATGKEAQVQLAPGEHPFRIDMFENAADDVLKLEWKRPGASTFEVVPPEVFTTPAGEVRVTAPGKKRVLPRGAVGRPGDRQPLGGVHPSYTLTSLLPKDFKPRVGGIDFLPDGRLVLCAWEGDGGVYILDGVTGSGRNVTVKRIAAGLAEPLGIKVVDNKIYVLQKQELTQLVDHDGDDMIDEYFAVANGWGVTPNFHEFAFGLVHKDGTFYATLATAIDPGGASSKVQNIDRGRIVRIWPSGKFEFVASGLRTPNGIGVGPKGRVFVADNQGDWLPSSKILLMQHGAFYGNRSVDPAGTQKLNETLPVVWLPQNEIGNSPSQPAESRDGPYKDQLLHGDVTHGGLKRVFMEEVDGKLQGAAFRFTQGLQAGVNRIVWGPDGALYIGGIGSTGNWGQEGKEWFGLQKIKYNGRPTFEMVAVRAKTNGMELEFTEPLAEGAGLDPDLYTVDNWRYVPTAAYGGDKIDDRRLAVRSVTVSKDRKRAFLELPDLRPETVVYVRVDPLVASASGRELWATEAWYTLNRIPKNQTVRVGQAQAANVLSAEEKQQGFKLLFDGQSTANWRGFRKTTLPTAWKAQDGMFSILPGTGSGGNVVTVEEYKDFDFRIEWRVEPGANSGIFYRSSEKFTPAFITGPEYQILDDARHPDGRSPLTSAGSNYALIAPSKKVVRPAGQWNQTRIVARGNRIEHYLNGFLVVSYEINSPEWKAVLAKSKFAGAKEYAQMPEGRIVLQDHGNRVNFRNIRIKRL